MSNFDGKKKILHGNKKYRENFSHAVPESLESCCIIAFDVAGEAAGSSQRPSSQMWALIKAVVDRSLSPIKPASPLLRKRGPVGKRKAEGHHTVLTLGARGGAGEKGRKTLTR